MLLVNAFELPEVYIFVKKTKSKSLPSAVNSDQGVTTTSHLCGFHGGGNCCRL